MKQTKRLNYWFYLGLLGGILSVSTGVASRMTHWIPGILTDNSFVLSERASGRDKEVSLDKPGTHYDDNENVRGPKRGSGRQDR